MDPRTAQADRIATPAPEQAAAMAVTLAAAFARFSETSRELTESYQALEQEAARLRRALRTARQQRATESRRHAGLARRFSALLEALPGGVLLLDADDSVLEANAAALGMLGEPVLGENWNQLRERTFTASTGDPGDLQLRNGRRLTLAQKSFQPGPGRVLLLTDITEKRQVEDLLSRHRRLAAMGEMAAALAHQIRTPLAAGLLYATSARRPELPAADRDSLLGKSISCLHDLERLIADMLQFARGATLAENRFALGELLDCVENALRAILLPGQQLSFSRPARDVTLAGNRETLASALLNLATNALNAAGASAQVRIRASARGLQAEITITDNGPGIDSALQERIFEPFFTSRAEGTGLGLSVARSIARAHRGDITLLDPTPGRTTFSLRLPIAAAAARLARPQRNAAA